ncbi:hypothetical protein KVR01_006548 [Diaporthe batatas]|uniref:uncharacterized protein n=1 Tax=Diaporthe batatas TaxID=748121 RepID=UPI001D04CB8C|nr:uncharacterized protein KVR01_006548 [Diaporthe batatas]KAG8163251.1 hypothetical protein KVR01_006548 [Diaporthe batatas]
MSHEQGNDGPIFRLPNNLYKVLDASLPSEQELLSPQATLRDCSYVVCVEDLGQTGMSPEDKAFTVEAFGNFEGLGSGEISSFTPLAFEALVEGIRERNPNVTPNLTVWSTSNLATPAKRVSSNQQYPLDCPVLYLFTEFRRSDYVPRAGHFREDFNVPFFPDNLKGGVSPSHIPEAPTGPEPDHTYPTYPENSVPRGLEATTGPEPNRAYATSPGDPMLRVQPKRTKTFESGKKAVSKLTIAVKNVAGTVKDIVSPREFPEQHTVLTELASTFDEEDYLTSLLATTGQRPEPQADIDHDQARLFQRFAQLFPHIDYRQHSANERSIHFRHCALAITPHQFVRACQILFQYDTTGLAGGLLASAMGSGKSIIVLASLVIRALLFESKRRVERELKPGASLIHVPSAAMPGWIEILEAALFNRRSYNVTVLYNGPRLSSRLEPSPDFLGGTRFNRWQMSARLPPGHPGGLITNSEELVWFAEPAPLSDPSLCLETYIIVMTHANPRLRELFSWEIRDLAEAPQNCEFSCGGLYALLIAIYDLFVA